MKIQERFIKLGKLHTRYLCSGETGPPVVLIHGIGASADIWKKNIRELARSSRVYAPDLVGFGYTDKPDIPYSPANFAHFLNAFTTSLGIGTASLIGLSLGGGIALLYTLDHPDRVEKLVLVDSAGLGKEVTLPMRLGTISFLASWLKVSRGTFGGLMHRLVYDPAVITEDLVTLYYSMYKSPGYMQIVSRVLKSVANLRGAKKNIIEDINERVPLIATPTLIIWGREDRIIPLKHALYAEQVIPGARLHVFEECGHLPNLEKPNEFNAIVTDFLSEK